MAQYFLNVEILAQSTKPAEHSYIINTIKETNDNFKLDYDGVNNRWIVNCENQPNDKVHSGIKWEKL